MNFSSNDLLHSSGNPSVHNKILTDAVFGGLGLVPLILENHHHLINPDLSDYFCKKSIVECDRLPQEPQHRSGVPQSHHVHSLLTRGHRSRFSL